MPGRACWHGSDTAGLASIRFDLGGRTRLLPNGFKAQMARYWAAMSQENVEIMRRGYERWSDTGEIRAHPDLVWDVSKLRWPGRQIYSGPEGANQFNAEWAEAWDGWKLEAEKYINAGERVVVIVNQRGRSKSTGIPVDMRFAQVWSFRDGQAIRMEMYANVDEAFEAAGRSE